MMSSSFVHFARAVQTAWGVPRGFRAVQTVEAGGFKLEARVRFVPPRALELQILEATNPVMEIESTLSGWVEYTAEDLPDLQCKHDGTHTWILDPRGPIVVQRRGRQLFEPLPGTALLGELSFLSSLLRDFYLRDRGSGTRDNRSTCRLGLKPKQTFRSGLLSTVTFPVETVTMDIDQETLFPLDISFLPTPDSPAAALLGPGVPVHIAYRDVVWSDTDNGPTLYAPPQDVRRFEDAPARWDNLESCVPFNLRLSSLRQQFPTAHASVRLSLDREHGRGFALVHLSERDDHTPAESGRSLSLLLGNYVCRSMARWRALLSDKGHASTRSDRILLLDRGPLWDEAFPGLDLANVPVDAFFQHHDLFVFLSETGASLDAVESIAFDLLEEQRAVPSPSA